MVPHVRILQAIAIVARCSGDEIRTRETFASHFTVAFPVDLFGQKAFWATEVIDRLPLELQVALETSQMHLTGDFSQMFAAAKVLGVEQYLQVGGSTITSISKEMPFITLPDEILVWRRTPTVRLAIECMLLCNIDVSTISSDMRRMYGRTFEESYLNTFRELFCDRTQVHDWAAYSRCIPKEELTMKYRLLQEPKDFVRWKLGVPVELDSDTVLDRMMSDAYYTERLLKHEARSTALNGLPALGQADIARIKLERDTIFKCMDRRIKMKEIAGQQSTAVNTIHKQLASLRLEFKTPETPLMSDLSDD